ncbi:MULTISPECIES: DUF485 domain-containing protein [Pseudofrankia]|uniref:DUF485 domain-containing protein n=1 Tax=Pseudofrankia TaxID=2994363 RepID=UPI000234D18B|nr:MULTISPECIES: DUF485 domain-containing protein [Pseudofrankia]OHV28774.1 hypothetical protein BCD49_37365 [Pseudofrankia sp. EUN1h]
MSTIQSSPGEAAPGASASGQESYLDLQRSPEFGELRRGFRRFVFPMTALFLAWYFLYVLLAAFASGFMSHKVGGNINVGLLFGLGQFLSTFVITAVYVRWADRRLDPAAAALRARFEGTQLEGTQVGGDAR